MPFPESPRVKYKNTPLTEVICQFRFPTILRIGAGEVADFQDKVRSQYPIYESKEPTFEFQNAPKELVPILEKLSIPTSMGPVTHRFYNKDKKRFIALSQEFLAYSDKSYGQWDIFREEVFKAEQALTEVFKPAFYIRIGLRYKNLIDPPQLGLNDYKWSNLLQKHLLAELGDDHVANSITETKTRTVINISDIPGARVTLVHGLFKDALSKYSKYLIDADFALEKTEGINGASEILDRFNRFAGRLFRWAITESLHKAMGPETV